MSWVCERSALLLCNPLDADALLLVFVFDNGVPFFFFFFVTELLDNVAAKSKQTRYILPLGFAHRRHHYIVILGLALRKSLFVYNK